MPCVSILATFAAIAFGSIAQARPIPHTVSLFRRAVLDANEGYLVIQNKDAPKDYSDLLEPYDHYHFRYMAIGCSDVSKETEFFDTCCQPRQVGKQSDDKYPSACRLASYLVFDPDYESDKVVAKLGSLRDYQEKIGYDEKDVEEGTASDAASSKDKESESSSSQPSSSSSWTVESVEKASSSNTWTSSSSAAQTWTPEAVPVSSSSSSTPWTAPTSSSQWTPEAAPAPSSSSQAWSEPASSSSPQAQAPAPSSSANDADNNSNSNNNSGGSSSGDFTGQASWYTQNGNPGACGIYHSDADHIVALQKDMYGNLGQQSQYCGRSLTITNTATGATAQAVVADACPGCATYHSLDLSTGLFQALGNLDQGILPISWHFN